MGEPIRSGTVLIREGISFPKALRFESVAWVPGWRVIKKLLGYSVGQRVQNAGWAFSPVGSEIKASAFGRGEGTVHRALRNILGRLKATRYNALEIKMVIARRFLGVLPYVSVTAHSRHIQEERTFLFGGA